MDFLTREELERVQREKAAKTHGASHAPATGSPPSGGTDLIPWQLVNQSGSLANRPPASNVGQGITYFVNDPTIQILYRSNGTTWTPQAAGVLQGLILAWAPSTFYKAGAPMIQGGITYLRTSDGTSRSTFDSTEDDFWTPLPVGLPDSDGTVVLETSVLLGAGATYTGPWTAFNGGTINSTIRGSQTLTVQIEESTDQTTAQAITPAISSTLLGSLYVASVSVMTTRPYFRLKIVNTGASAMDATFEAIRQVIA